MKIEGASFSETLLTAYMVTSVTIQSVKIKVVSMCIYTVAYCHA
jgi:hypothetical protein